MANPFVRQVGWKEVLHGLRTEGRIYHASGLLGRLREELADTGSEAGVSWEKKGPCVIRSCSPSVLHAVDDLTGKPLTPFPHPDPYLGRILTRAFVMRL